MPLDIGTMRIEASKAAVLAALSSFYIDLQVCIDAPAGVLSCSIDFEDGRFMGIGGILVDDVQVMEFTL